KIVLFSCVFLFSCEPKELELSNMIPDVEESQPDESNEDESNEGENKEDDKQDETGGEKEDEEGKGEGEDKTPIGSKFEEIGKGSGNLIIKNVEGKKYSVKPGIYSNFHLEN